MADTRFTVDDNELPCSKCGLGYPHFSSLNPRARIIDCYLVDKGCPLFPKRNCDIPTIMLIESAFEGVDFDG